LISFKKINLKTLVKKICKSVIPARILTSLLNEAKTEVHNFYKFKYEHSELSYSQEGEDLILERIFAGKANGFFVDIGAHHPKRFSNTYKFYLKGWRGINVDPMPGSMVPFNEIRPEDINLEIGVSNEEGELEFFIFNEPALNTFNKAEADKKNNFKGYHIERTQPIKTYLLKDILAKYLPQGKQIDFMTIDVEGNDMLVLSSNDWGVYRPKYLLVEELEADISKIIESGEISVFLKSKDYSLVSRTFNTSIYKVNEI
jgi:FkbM family methyltransferase